MKVTVTKIFNVQIQEIILLKSGKTTYAFHNLFDFITNYKEFLGKTFFIQGLVNEKNVSFYGKYLGGRKFRVVENPDVKMFNANFVQDKDTIQVFSCYHLRESIFLSDTRALPFEIFTITNKHDSTSLDELLEKFKFEKVSHFVVDYFNFDFSKFINLLYSKEYLDYLKTLESNKNANLIYILVSNRFIFSFKSDDEVNEMIKNAQYTPVVSKFPLIKVKDIITGSDIIGIFQSDTIKKYDNTKLILEFDKLSSKVNDIPLIFRLVSSFEDEGNNN